MTKIAPWICSFFVNVALEWWVGCCDSHKLCSHYSLVLISYKWSRHIPRKKVNGAAAMYYLVGLAQSRDIWVSDRFEFSWLIFDAFHFELILFNSPGNCAFCPGSLHRRRRTHRLGVRCGEKGSRRRVGASDPLPKTVAHMHVCLHDWIFTSSTCWMRLVVLYM